MEVMITTYEGSITVSASELEYMSMEGQIRYLIKAALIGLTYADETAEDILRGECS